MTNYVAYYRVSTTRQEHGIDAQRMQVQKFAEQRGGVIIAEFHEHESGKNDHRPQLALAIGKAQDQQATLLIAKLDRLSRNAGFLFALKERLEVAGVEVMAADMPEVLSNTLMLAVMAGMAQHEREMISKRTKEGLAAAKAKGKQIGRRRGCDTSAAVQASSIARRDAALKKSKTALNMALTLHNENRSLCEIAVLLTKCGIKTPTGKDFNKYAVWRLLKITSQQYTI